MMFPLTMGRRCGAVSVSICLCVQRLCCRLWLSRSETGGMEASPAWVVNVITRTQTDHKKLHRASLTTDFTQS